MQAILNCFNYYRKCPEALLAPLIKIVVDEVRGSCKKNPPAYGFNPSDEGKCLHKKSKEDLLFKKIENVKFSEMYSKITGTTRVR